MKGSLHHQRKSQRWTTYFFLQLIFVLAFRAVRSTSSNMGNENKYSGYQCISNESPFTKSPSIIFDDGSLMIHNSRRAEESATPFKGCDICGGLHGTGILADAPIPSFPPMAPTKDLPEGFTCTDWNNYLMQSASPGSYDCSFFAYFLASQCCDRTNMIASYICESKLKTELLGEDSGYDITAVPVPAGEDNLNATVVLTFYHIASLDTVEGTAELFFSIDLNWIDERLAWNPSEHDGCLSIDVHASLDRENAEIFVPDFNLLNRVEGVQSLPEEIAVVTADGGVRWRRNGGLKGICAFTGLEPIPFDTLGCFYSFGSITGRKIFYQFGGGDPGTPGLIFSNFPSKYQEFSLIPERSETFIEVVAFTRTLSYQFFFERAKDYYLTKILVPTILLTYLSFGIFLLDLRVGERLSFGVSLLLVLVAQSIVTSDMLPISDEKLWIDMFVLASYYWIVLGVLESVVVAYLFFLDSEEEREEERIREEEEQIIEEQGLGTRNEYREHDIQPGEYPKSANIVSVSNKSHSIESSNDFPTSEESSASKKRSFSRILFRFSGENDHKRSILPRPALKRSKAISFGQIITRKKKPTMRRKLKMIHGIDLFCLIVLPTTYTLFIIIMFATSSVW